MTDKVMPEYPTITFKGYSEDYRKLIIMVGKSTREVPNDEIGIDNFKYILYRLDRLIKYKREKIAMDNIK